MHDYFRIYFSVLILSDALSCDMPIPPGPICFDRIGENQSDWIQAAPMCHSRKIHPVGWIESTVPKGSNLRMKILAHNQTELSETMCFPLVQKFQLKSE